MMTETLNAARIKVFWQPGCSSCLRTKEFLTEQGIEFESLDVHNDPDALAQLVELGARSVPVVSIGKRYTFCQSIHDVIKFLDLKTRVMDPLPPAQLVAKLDLLMSANARYIRQFTAEQLKTPFRNRHRTPAGLGFHMFRVAEMGMQAAQGIPLRFESFDELPPDDWSGEDIAAWGERVHAKFLDWWAAESDPMVNYSVETYYGTRPFHEVLERTAWHAAQHTRQVMLMLESDGIAPDGPLSAADLEGLPVPHEVWDR
ncbi:glutaredoxin domain-containing protein [Burkholderia sp. PAMC 26561]|uniref:glutaredoxin domain-containing protein n=1 Tax=Burkholderia sp. PAMC 26561 TaxID=1795043 RepID=UPI001F1726C3|nr:glutaredoxin domain-containing protein [Burkholderia sp. PAMC 26561]